MNPLSLSQIPMSDLKRKLKQVAGGLMLASLFLMAGIAVGGPVETPATTQANAIVCNVEAAAPQACTKVESIGDARLDVRSAMRMPYFSFGKLLPRTSVLTNVVEP